jgi:hypothetical protein
MHTAPTTSWSTISSSDRRSWRSAYASQSLWEMSNNARRPREKRTGRRPLRAKARPQLKTSAAMTRTQSWWRISGPRNTEKMRCTR